MAFFVVTIGDLSFSVTLDSGSSDLLIPLATCTSCIGPGLNNTKILLPYSAENKCQYSHAIAPGGMQQYCAFNVTYGGSMTLENVKGTTTLTLGNAAGSNTTIAQSTFGATFALDFGPQTRAGKRRSAHVLGRLGGYEPPQGVAGFAFSSLASSRATPLWQQYAAESKSAAVFSHCFAENGEGGSLTLGGRSPYGDPSTLATVNVTARDFWRIEALDTLVDGKSIGVPSSEYNADAIVDSGTPFVTMPTAVFRAFSTAFAAAAPNVTLARALLSGHCVNVSAAEVATLPTIDFILSSTRPGVHTRLSYAPASYVLESSTFCQYGGSILTLADGGDGFFVLGSSFLRQFAVSYFNPEHGTPFVTFERAVGCPSHVAL